jgi:hypothetical protein
METYRRCTGLPGIEVEVFHVVFVASPDHAPAEGEGVASFERDAVPVAGEIGDDELGTADIDDDAVADVLVAGLFDDPNWAHPANFTTGAMTSAIQSQTASMASSSPPAVPRRQ